jgi:hypothetical protein
MANDSVEEAAGAVRDYFDALGAGEWDRLVQSPSARVSLELHRRFLARFIRPGWRVLEIGAGPGRFTGNRAWRRGARQRDVDDREFPLVPAGRG